MLKRFNNNANVNDKILHAAGLRMKRKQSLTKFSSFTFAGTLTSSSSLGIGALLKACIWLNQSRKPELNSALNLVEKKDNPIYKHLKFVHLWFYLLFNFCICVCWDNLFKGAYIHSSLVAFDYFIKEAMLFHLACNFTLLKNMWVVESSNTIRLNAAYTLSPHFLHLHLRKPWLSYSCEITLQNPEKGY